MNEDIRVRVGVNTGPVTAGVIGTRKFAYDPWGDAVNVASRMESSGEPNAVQVTEQVYESVRGRFPFELRRRMTIKGKGEMNVYSWKI